MPSPELLALGRQAGATNAVARVFISSTFQDLRDHREAVYVAVRRLGHESEGVEEWAATDQPPLEQSLANLRASDVVLFLIGWRYGYIPEGQQYSITELEYQVAREARLPCLIFMTETDAPWPKQYVDDDASNIERFRQNLLKNDIVAFFTTPESLAKQVAVSLQSWVASGLRELSPTTPEAVSSAETPGPEVFLSYAHEDAEIAQSVSERIGREKWSVFWDRTIPVGFTWDDIVEGALRAAKCVVVLWSPAARNSEWVRIEAVEGADRRILAPAVIKETEIPLRFRRIQAADLMGWSPHRPDTPGMQGLISAIKRLCPRLAVPPKPTESRTSVSKQKVYLIFYDGELDNITPDGMHIARLATQEWKERGGRILVTGYDDTQELSERRAKNAAGALALLGVPLSAMTVSAADGVRELQNPRVEIVFPKS